jgi:hypothetical protein
MATGIDEEALQARFEDLTVLEDEFDDVELEISTCYPFPSSSTHNTMMSSLGPEDAVKI